MEQITFTRVLGDGPPHYVSDDGHWRVQRVSRTTWRYDSEHFNVHGVQSTYTQCLDRVRANVLELVKPSKPQKSADSEPFDFTSIDAAADDVDRKTRHLASATSALVVEVNAAREAGVSWTTIGHHLGLSKQGAQQRYGAKS